MAVKDLVNNRFGKLLVVKRLPSQLISGKKRVFWECICDCGTSINMNVDVLKRSFNKPKSCGECNEESFYYKTVNERNSWKSMIYRCNNVSAINYKDYGGRGITVCDRWLESFENFYEDMGERPKAHTLDRIETDGNYEPSNCKWSSVTDQNINTRKRVRNTSGKTGVYWYKKFKKWEVKISINKKQKYLGMYEQFEEAVEVRQAAELEHYGKILGH